MAENENGKDISVDRTEEEGNENSQNSLGQAERRQLNEAESEQIPPEEELIHIEGVTPVERLYIEESPEELERDNVRQEDQQREAERLERERKERSQRERQERRKGVGGTG